MSCIVLLTCLVVFSRVVKKEALWVLSNITSTQDTEIISKVVELGAIKHLSELVSQGAFDIRKGVSLDVF